jgi:hypothetical protein
MAKRIIRRGKAPKSSAAINIEQWPAVWRVVAPACGSYDHDMMFLETESEAEARRRFHALRGAEWPVRLERVQCGPLPAKAKTSLDQMRSANAQNPGTSMRNVPAYWEVAHG